MASESQNDVSQGKLDLEMVPMPSPSDAEELPPLKDQTSPGRQQTSNILSLTLNEIQFKSGKSLGSMNMDEFLASIWSVDEGLSLPSSESEHVEDNNKLAAETGPAGLLLRQASFSIPTPLCNKTVDEVWFEIHKDQRDKQEQPDPEAHSIGNREPPRRKQTLGDMTLEDFLVKAGVSQGQAMPSQPKSLLTSAFLKPPPGIDDSTPSIDHSFGARNLTGFGLISNSPGSGNNISGNGIMGKQLMIFGNSSNRCAGESSCNIFNEKSLGSFGLKRRIIDGPPEVAVERRHRRMIKNRESAARSRARKQAYTVELEVELNQLREENERLKRIVAEIEEKRQKEATRRRQHNGWVKPADQLKCIRRTVSNAW